MEDLPRSPDRENDSEDDEQQLSSELKSNAAQEFMKRWKRFGARSEISAKSIDLEDEEDEENDEDDETSETMDPSTKKRFRRLRRKLRPFLPQPHEISEKQPPNELPTVPAEVLQEDFSKQVTVEEILDSVENDVHYASNYEVKDNESSATSEEHPVERVLPSIESANDDLEELTSVEYVPPAPEPESLQQILTRHDLRQNPINRSERSSPKPVDMADRPVVDRDSRYQAIRDHTIERRPAPIGGLLAVDLLNYHVAKKRDAKNMKINEREQKKLRDQQENIQSTLHNHISESKEQQQKAREVRFEPVINNNEQIKSNMHNVIYNKKNAEESSANQKVVYAPEQPNVSRLHDSIVAVKDKVHESEAITNFQRTLERVERAEHGTILSESLYERKHEVKDSPGGGRQFTGSSAPYDFDPSTYQQQFKATDQAFQQAKLASKAVDKNQTDQAVYKQAAVTGFWGALAGIVIFIIIYVLGSR